METPWGNLNELNINDHEIAESILSLDKHQLIEGLVAECLFDQIMSTAPRLGEKVISLNVDTIIVDTKRKKERWVGFVWAKTRDPGLGRYLQALEKAVAVYLITYRNGNFIVNPTLDGKISGKGKYLHELMSEISTSKYNNFEVNSSVKNQERQRQVFWGFISNYYKERIGEKISLPRILINIGIQPYFRSVWNLDRAYIIDDQVWILEIKHKYPINGKNRLAFGINNGELNMISKLTIAGIKCLHTVIVKPYWSKDTGSMYLLNSLSTREKAAIIAIVLDDLCVNEIMKSGSDTSATHTSITGNSKVFYKRIPCSAFKKISVLSEPANEISKVIFNLIANSDSIPVVEDSWLRKLRIYEN
ncbi:MULTISPECIES: hypothetical protein [Serratia]|uniref:hypothetical protein n=1 Tax=Serratia TaxID=613 RepID=UPI0013176AB1|nr:MULTISPECIES: hypothetical protein [Serratia]MBH2582360.1 hypothetical protein [Serratia marcescens]MDI3150470.1 hypothetical protein [Serratia nevei]QHC47903.1 hypothetical protein EFZ62_24365 [Serratia marcescens]